MEEAAPPDDLVDNDVAAAAFAAALAAAALAALASSIAFLAAIEFLLGTNVPSPAVFCNAVYIL